MSLDRWAQGFLPVCRMYFGDGDEKPNDFCFWDGDRGEWCENDAHFRERVIESLEGVNNVNTSDTYS